MVCEQAESGVDVSKSLRTMVRWIAWYKKELDGREEKD